MTDLLTCTVGRFADRMLSQLVPQVEAAATLVVECRCRGGVHAEVCRHKVGYYCRQLGTRRPWVFKHCCVA